MHHIAIKVLVGLLLIGMCMLLFLFVLPKVVEDNARNMALQIEEAIKQDCGITDVKVDPKSFDELALWTKVYEPKGKSSVYIQCTLPSTEHQIWKCACK